MGRQTKISWTDSTFNPWIGCTKVSDGCKFCYAELLNRRWGSDNWGPGKTRRMTSDTYWRQPLSWNRDAQKNKQRQRVFCASLADVFDDEAPDGGRERLWELIERTPMLDWLLLTKRPHNILSYIPPAWKDQPPFNVWYGTTVEDYRVAYRIDILEKVPAAIRFLSIEPLIGEPAYPKSFKSIHWAIFGGESGTQARPAKNDGDDKTPPVCVPRSTGLVEHWIRRGIRQCRKNGVVPFVKQMGDAWAKDRRAKDSSGTDPLEWPLDLQIQEFPRDRYGYTVGDEKPRLKLVGAGDDDEGITLRDSRPVVDVALAAGQLFG